MSGPGGRGAHGSDGADGGTRTRTLSREADFKSAASTGFATSAQGLRGPSMPCRHRLGQPFARADQSNYDRVCWSPGPQQSLASIEADAHFLAGLEVRHALWRDGDGCSGARIAARAGIACARGECAKAAQLNPAPFREARGNGIEHDIHDAVNFRAVQIRVQLCKLLYELRTNHLCHFPIWPKPAPQTPQAIFPIPQSVTTP